MDSMSLKCQMATLPWSITRPIKVSFELDLSMKMIDIYDRYK